MTDSMLLLCAELAAVRAAVSNKSAFLRRSSSHLIQPARNLQTTSLCRALLRAHVRQNLQALRARDSLYRALIDATLRKEFTDTRQYQQSSQPRRGRHWVVLASGRRMPQGGRLILLIVLCGVCARATHLSTGASLVTVRPNLLSWRCSYALRCLVWALPCVDVVATSLAPP